MRKDSHLDKRCEKTHGEKRDVFFFVVFVDFVL